MGNPETLSLLAVDPMSTRLLKVDRVSAEATVGELVRQLVSDLELPPNDAQGRPREYYARLEREQRHLFDAESVGDALREGDRIALVPDIQAGLARR